MDWGQVTSDTAASLPEGILSEAPHSTVVLKSSCSMKLIIICSGAMSVQM